MDKANLLKSVADTAYNVGFGAKKHFANFDIAQKAPGLIAFASLATGVFALVYDSLSNKFIGACVVVLAIVGLYVSLYDLEKRSYEETGANLTQLYTKLRDLYRDIQSAAKDADLSTYQDRLKAIEDEYYKAGNSKQILLSDWYAHYKFFWQHQIDWVDEQKHFRLFRDKIPLSFMFAVALLIIGIVFL